MSESVGYCPQYLVRLYKDKGYPLLLTGLEDSPLLYFLNLNLPGRAKVN